MSQSLTIKQRFVLPTPPFFIKLQVAGVMLATVGGALMAAPVPAIVAKIAGYLVVAGGVATTVGQTAVKDSALQQLVANEQQ